MSSNTTNNSSILNSPFVLTLLNDYGVSNYYLYLHPILCAISTVLGLVNTIVLSTRNLRTNGPFFQYSLVNSAGAVVASCLFLFVFLSRCGGSICSISTAYSSQAFMIYGIYYVGYIYYSSSAIIQIAIGLQLYLSIKQKFKWFINLNPYNVCAVIYVVFILLTILNIFLYQTESFLYFKLDQNGQVVSEKFYYNRLNSSSIYVLICTIVLSITSYSPFIVLIVLNVLIYVELRRVMARRRNIIGPSTTTGGIKPDENSSKSAVAQSGMRLSFSKTTAATTQISAKPTSNREAYEKKSLRRSLIMTLWVSLIFSVDRLVKCVYRLVVLFMPLSSVSYYLNATSFLIDSLTYMSFFFVYMNTNKIFKRTFYEIFLRRKSN